MGDMNINISGFGAWVTFILVWIVLISYVLKLWGVI